MSYELYPSHLFFFSGIEYSEIQQTYIIVVEYGSIIFTVCSQLVFIGCSFNSRIKAGYCKVGDMSLYSVIDNFTFMVIWKISGGEK